MSIRFVLPALVVQIAALCAPAYGQSSVVLRVTSESALADGRVALTLASGEVIKVPSADLDRALTKAVNQAVKSSEATRQSAQTTSGLGAEAEGALRSHCAKEWSDDFRMRAYCEGQQREALLRMRDRSMQDGDRVLIRRRCESEWAVDYRMRNYCEEQQLNALKQLGR